MYRAHRSHPFPSCIFSQHKIFISLRSHIVFHDIKMEYTLPLPEFFVTESDNLIGQSIEPTYPFAQRARDVARRRRHLNPFLDHLYRQSSRYGRATLPDRPLAPPQRFSPVSISSDTSSQSNGSNPSSTRPRTPTMADEEKSKTVRFVENFEHNSYKIEKKELSRTAKHLKALEAYQELCKLVTGNPIVKHAILGFKQDVLYEIARSLDHDLARVFTDVVDQIRGPYANWFNILYTAPTQAAKEALLLLLDEKTTKRYLCRSCDLFHAKPGKSKAKDLDSPLQDSCCPSQYVLGERQTPGRLFDLPFSFAQIQLAMKLFRQGLDYRYVARLKPLSSPTIDVHPSYSHIRTSDSYPAFDRLLNRTRHWYHVSSDVTKPFSERELISFCKKTTRTPGRKVAILCQHLHSSENDEDLWDFQNQENNPSVKRCQHCSLEYRFDWYDAGEHGSGLVLSIWRDLGRCLTPFDPRWAVHFEEYKTWDFTRSCTRESEGIPRWKNYMEPAASEAPVGYIQKMFEDSDGFDLQDGLQVLIGSPERKGLFERARNKRRNDMEMLRKQANLPSLFDILGFR